MLWLDMGLGKTVITLTALKFLMATGKVDRILIVAPLRVCQTVWEHETYEWDHLGGLKFSYVLGSEKKRTRALFADADIYLINYENLTWLSGIFQHYYSADSFPFQAIVWDEISKMKHSTSERGKAFGKVNPWFSYHIGLTGSPCSNGLSDLHGQYLMVDGGERLTERITHFRERWFYQEAYTRKYKPYPGSQKQIESRIYDITLQMKAKDYLEVPVFNISDIVLTLPDPLRKAYDKFEKEMFLQLDSGHEVTAFNAATLSTKCLQFANGNIYTEVGVPESAEGVHKLKLDALMEIVDETGDEPILLAYSFKSDAAAIMREFPEAVNLSGMTATKLTSTLSQWNAGEIKLMIGHPASMGHGLNLQYGGSRLVWYGLPWALDLYEQFNARICRQGQTKPVFCYRILVAGTVEQAVILALESKASTQSDLRDAIQTYRETKS